MVKSSVVLVSLGLGLSVAACSGQSGPKTAEVKPGEMPAGGAWKGVWYSQTYGYLHLTEEGSAVVGAWRTTAGDAWGELAGEADGDLLRYEWTEHKIGALGAAADRSGKGYFRYTVPKEGEAHEIVGEWGLGEDEVGGGSWNALKQKNMEPDPKSVRPDEIEGRVEGGGWDGSQPIQDETSEDLTEEEPKADEKKEGEGDAEKKAE